MPHQNESPLHIMRNESEQNIGWCIFGLWSVHCNFSDPRALVQSASAYESLTALSCSTTTCAMQFAKKKTKQKVFGFQWNSCWKMMKNTRCVQPFRFSQSPRTQVCCFAEVISFLFFLWNSTVKHALQKALAASTDWFNWQFMLGEVTGNVERSTLGIS